jgi:hypothetical protein
MTRNSKSGLFCLLLFLLPSITAQAVDNISLSIEQLETEAWQLQGVRIALTGLSENSQQMGLSIDKLTLPAPYDVLTFINIQCPIFLFKPEKITCDRGKAEIRSPWLDAPATPISFQFTENKSQLKLLQLKIFGGTVSLTVNLQQHWQIQLHGRNVNVNRLQQFINNKAIASLAGKINFQATAVGDGSNLQAVRIKLDLQNLQVQTADGRFAGEGISASANFQAKKILSGWQWNNHLLLNSGAVYAEPVYLEVTGPPVEINAAGLWDKQRNRLNLQAVKFVHPGLGILQGHAEFYLNDPLQVETATLSLQTDSLAALTEVYFKPFMTASALEGFGFSGELKGQIEIVQQQLSNVALSFKDIDITDTESRFALQKAAGVVHWSNNPTMHNQSKISWQQLDIYELPIGPAKLLLTTNAKQVRLEQRVEIPFLGGKIAINRFDFHAVHAQEPEIHFDGALENVSLGDLSAALDWTPLSGTLTGQIEGLKYSKDTISVDGELNLQVFDGEIEIKNLAISDLFSDLPQFYSDIELHNLDLNEVTKKLDFGNIKGRISGRVQNLYMEDWTPVSFYAWMGTPDGDDSQHRISQQAVKNLASIGGGGAADILSRGFLRFFDAFSYDKIGFGCYLHQGVCQLMGVEAAKAGEGFYIVKGSGLPRIDVIGYNTRINWDVLLKRLARISTTDNAVVE